MPGGHCYHDLNRGNARQRVFDKDADYSAFLRLLDEAHKRHPMRLLAYCLMPNHFHLFPENSCCSVVYLCYIS